MPQDNTDQPSDSGANWMRLVTLGTELAATTLVMTGIGYAIDSWRSAEDYYVTAGLTLVGFVCAMFRFVRTVTIESRPK